MSVLSAVKGILDKVSRGAATLSAVVLILVMAVTLIDVFCRYVLNSPILGVRDVTEASMVVIVFAALGRTALMGDHVALDVLDPYFKGWFDRLTRTIVQLLIVAIYAVLAWRSLITAQLNDLLGTATNILFLPVAPFQYVIAACSVMGALAHFLLAIDAATHAHKHQELSDLRPATGQLDAAAEPPEDR